MTIDLSGLDLGALEHPAAAPSPGDANGKPLAIPLADIEEDPDQPRKEFDQDRMAEMVASIRASGVKSPISVRPHPSKPGKFILNHGARRYRGSVEAGTGTIPAFVDEQHTDYDQVIENIQREDLTARELAMFIHRKITKDGEKKQAIAKKLGKPNDLVTFHLALIDPPEVVDDAYTSGKCTSPRTLYDLRALAEKYPEQVQAWYEQVPDVTRATVAALAAELKPGKKAPKDFVTTKSAGEGSGEPRPLTGTTGEGGQGAAGEGAAGAGAGTAQGQNDPGVDNGELTSWPKGKAVSDPNLMKRPLLLVTYEDRAAALLLNRRPTTDALVWVRFEDSGRDEEVAASALSINRLMEE